jgi:cobalt-zinc-cadmium resistance protein CzcA
MNWQKKWAKPLEDVPGITTGFQFPVQMRFNELMTGARQDVVLKIFGEDLDTLAKYADQLGKLPIVLKEVRIYLLNQLQECPNCN